MASFQQLQILQLIYNIFNWFALPQAEVLGLKQGLLDEFSWHSLCKNRAWRRSSFSPRFYDYAHIRREDSCMTPAVCLHQMPSHTALLEQLHILLSLQHGQRKNYLLKWVHAAALAYRHIPPAIAPHWAQSRRWWYRRHHKGSGPLRDREKET